ncbi:cell death regulator Aven [Nelusetta ayraudi]|uniref:cell death regulator Aven n=1 Tax=Nelusetta ayraudi TaxID=303726 RepID=UPI003F6EDC81
MEGRLSRGRGGSWKRGERGGKEGGGSEGERRGRGRGGHHRGRGKRDHYHGRGRGGGAHAAEFHHRRGDEEENVPEEGEDARMFSRRKLESNWDRYQDSEKVECDDDTPTVRGTDFDVLLAAAGDSFSQFRFSEEKDWGMDSFAINEITASLLDLPALADLLQKLPLHQRLDLEPELFQDPPTSAVTSKQEAARVPATEHSVPAFKAPSAPFQSLSIEPRAPAAKNPAPARSGAAGPELGDVCGDDDELLDQLLGLGQRVSAATGSQTVGTAEQGVPVPGEAREDVKEAEKKDEEEEEEVKDELAAPPRKKEVTEEELEDWLDSMIS